jgi:hypothetical protein
MRALRQALSKAPGSYPGQVQRRQYRWQFFMVLFFTQEARHRV